MEVKPIKPANTVNSCVLCSEDYKGYGHNPWPLNGGRGRCCDNCNDYVLLARLARINRLAEGKKPDPVKERIVCSNTMRVDDRTYDKIKSVLDMKV